jgi:hypothetical protein
MMMKGLILMEMKKNLREKVNIFRIKNNKKYLFDLIIY